MPKFQWYTLFPSQDIKQDVLLSSYLDNWWHYLRSCPKAIFDKGERGEDENTKIWISQEPKNHFFIII